MTDNTVYTVVSDNDRPGTTNSNGFFEKNAVLPNTPGASIDNTTYAVDDIVNGNGSGNGTGSFYEKNTIYESLLLDSASNAGATLPLMDATLAAIGVSTKWSREDHVHPENYNPVFDTAFIGYPTDIMLWSGPTKIQSVHNGVPWGLTDYQFGNDSFGTNFYFVKSRASAFGDHGLVQNNDDLGWLVFGGDDGVTYNHTSCALRASVDGVATAGDVPGKLELLTANPGGASGGFGFSTKMAIYSTGHVAIPTNIPSTSTTTGSLTVAGGAGILGDLNVGGVASAATAAVDTNTTQLATTAYFFGQASASNPLAAGTAAPGTSSRWSRQDHVHPTDTTRAALASPTFTGIPAAPTAAVDTNTTQLATTAFVLAQAAAVNPLAAGTAAPGTSTRFARADHVHPTDTTRAPTASPTFTGTVTAAAIAATGAVKSSGGALGYATGAGGTVTQATSKATGVTLSKFSGAVTMNAAALASGAIASFVMTNTNIAAGDVLVLNHISGGTIGPYLLNAQCAAGSATINVRNTSAASLSEAIVIQFALVKAVNA